MKNVTGGKTGHAPDEIVTGGKTGHVPDDNVMR